eukprot:COSAG01_NODE_1241_length_11085_cov_9.712361_26_plen_184_part_00
MPVRRAEGQRAWARDDIIMCIRVGAHHPVAHPRPHRPLTQGVVQIIHSLVQIVLRSRCIGPRPHIHSAVLWLCDTRRPHLQLGGFHATPRPTDKQRPAQLTNLAGAFRRCVGGTGRHHLRRSTAALFSPCTRGGTSVGAAPRAAHPGGAAHTRQPRIIATARLASAQGSRSLWALRSSKAQRY